MIPSTCELVAPKSKSATIGQLSKQVVKWNEDRTGLVVIIEGGSALAPFVDALNELLELPENWNEKGASAIHHEAAINALRLFGEVGYDDTPLPYVSPLSSGNVELCWELDDVQLRLDVSGEGMINARFLEVGKQPESWDESFSYSVVKIRRYIDILTTNAQNRAPHLMAALIEKVEKFRSYQANWGTYGEHPVRGDACDAARDFIRYCGLRRPSLKLHVYPTSAGLIGCEFKKGNEELALIFSGANIKLIRDSDDDDRILSNAELLRFI